MKEREPVERELQHQIETNPEVYRSRYPEWSDIQWSVQSYQAQGTPYYEPQPFRTYNMWNERAKYVSRGTETPPDAVPLQPDENYVWWYDFPEYPWIARTEEEWLKERIKRPLDFRRPPSAPRQRRLRKREEPPPAIFV